MSKETDKNLEWLKKARLNLSIEKGATPCLCANCDGIYLDREIKSDDGVEWVKCNKCGDQRTKVSAISGLSDSLLSGSAKAVKFEEDYFNTEQSLEDLEKVLNLTITGDYTLKMILFLTGLLTFTEDSQTGVIITGPSGGGKTHNMTEVGYFFSTCGCIEREDGATKKSFIHKKGVLVDPITLKEIKLTKPIPKISPKEEWDFYYETMRKAVKLIDFSRKLLIFPDMNDSELLKTIRPILSHDQKICKYETTETLSTGIKTKVTLIRGFLTCWFASAITYFDEQETTRFFLVSVETTQEKQKASIKMQTRKASDPKYADFYERDLSRNLLQSRVKAIADFHCKEIIIPIDVLQPLEDWVITKTGYLNPKSSRDYDRIMDLVKAWTLFNWRNRRVVDQEDILVSEDIDVKVAIELYEKIFDCNSVSLSQEEYDIWLMLKEHPTDLLKISRIHEIYFENKKTRIDDKRLRGILKSLVRSNKLNEEKEGQSWVYFVTLNDKEKKEKEEREKQEIANAINCVIP